MGSTSPVADQTPVRASAADVRHARSARTNRRLHRIGDPIPQREAIADWACVRGGRDLRTVAILASAATALALATPVAVAGIPRTRSAQVSPEAAAATVLTWPQLVKLLHIPKPAGWRSGDLTSWEIGSQVSASRIFGNSQTTGSFNMIMTAIDSWTDAAASAQNWAMLVDAAAKQAGVTVLSRTATRSVIYGVGQYNQRGVTVSILLGPWSVGASCYTNKPKVSLATLSGCATKTAKAQQSKSTPVVAPR